MDIENVDDKGRIGEAFVNNIAYKSIIRHWCYPGLLDITGNGKEICDLLVIFDTVCVIVSVKNYSFKDDYEKYFKRTTEKAIKQINGAERKLFGDRAIVLKHPDRKEEVFKKDRITEIYRIVVNLNTDIKFFQTSYVQNEKHFTIMDAEGWSGALMELNTLPDFISYLKARCSLFSSYPVFIFPRDEYDFDDNAGTSSHRIMTSSIRKDSTLAIILGTELDLIAYYIGNGYKFPMDGQLRVGEPTLFQLDGTYQEFSQSDVAAYKFELERESYFIDELVRNAILQYEDGQHLARMLMGLTRMQRASFAKTFLEFHDEYRLGNEKVKMHARSAVICTLPVILFYFDDPVTPEELKIFAEARTLHFHYLSHFATQEIGLIGMSKSDRKFFFGFSKNNRKPSNSEIEVIEQKFASYGWKLRSAG